MTHFDSGKNLLVILLFSDCIFTIQGKLLRQKNQPVLWHGGTGQNGALGYNVHTTTFASNMENKQKECKIMFLKIPDPIVLLRKGGKFNFM